MLPRLALMMVFMGAIGVLVKSLVSPASTQRPALPAIADPRVIRQSALEQKGVMIELEEVNAFSANSRRFQRDWAIARSYPASQAQVHHEPNWGSYLLSRDRTHERLTACVTPHANSIGSYEDYLHHNHSQPLHPRKLATWVLGLGPVRDARCLWVTLSIPIDTNQASEGRRAQLQAAFRIILNSV